MLESDLSTTLGKQGVLDGRKIDGQALRFEGYIGSTVSVHGDVQHLAGPDCIGICIEESFSGQVANDKALFPALRIAVFAGELAGLQ